MVSKNNYATNKINNLHPSDVNGNPKGKSENFEMLGIYRAFLKLSHLFKIIFIKVAYYEGLGIFNYH